MKNLKMLFAAGFIFLCCACSGGCSGNLNEQQTETSLGEKNNSKNQLPLTLVNWNLQTFFDTNKDGCEYSEFQKSSDWNKEKYNQRLVNLCQVITSLDADIYVFEELENEGIIYDISNNLAGSGQNWNQKKFWNYSVFAKEEGTAIGIGILSRYPLSKAKTHSMDIRLHKDREPAIRYIVEASVYAKDRTLTILANHWKSKLGGTEATEIWRDWQESILAKRICELLKNESGQNACDGIIICGDFNRDAQDFICNFKESSSYLEKQQNTILRFADFGFTDFVSAQSMWFSDYGGLLHQTGSYVYDDQWERIDNILITGNLRIAEAGPCISSPWALAKGYPYSYKLYSGQGFSDHLPVMAKILIM